MNRLRVCIVFFAFAVIAACAEQTNAPTPTNATNNAAPSGVTSTALPVSITIDSTTYENVRWGRVTPSTVTIFHTTGVATIPLDKLPPDLQNRFGYDDQRAKDYQQKMMVQQAAQLERDRQNAIIARQRWERQSQIEAIKKSSLDAKGVVLQILADGILANEVETKFSYTAEQWGPRKRGNLALTHESHVVVSYRPISESGEPIFIVGAGGNFADGERWQSVIYPAGTYRYQATSGGIKTVRCFALSAEDAWKHLNSP